MNGAFSLGKISAPNLDLVGVHMLVNLKKLNLAGNQIISLEGFKTLKRLEYFDLSSNLIASLTEVSKLQANEALRHLHLKGNPVANKK